ncbi:MAG: hypothetical protein IPN42_13265 [Methylococcaceae bacterium]|nr:hypothetical protein [Methylococcaceae bacterium]
MRVDLDTSLNQSEKEDLQGKSQAQEQSQSELYPAVNERLKRLVGWLGLVFIVAVILVQQFSGYS